MLGPVEKQAGSSSAGGCLDRAGGGEGGNRVAL